MKFQMTNEAFGNLCILLEIRYWKLEIFNVFGDEHFSINGESARI